jgi:hypothetical protein
MSENRGRADMLCLLIHGRFVPIADIIGRDVIRRPAGAKSA